MKKLSEMTLKELWELFPIILSEPKTCWGEWFEEEKKSIERFAPKGAKIYHVGSTAVKGIWAKPIIDIVVELENQLEMQTLARVMEQNGYIVMNESSIARISLNKGYTEKGFAEKVFHVHLRIFGDKDEMFFRDYLNKNPVIAKEYERLKLELWKKFEYDRDAYTDAKTEFIRKYTQIAKLEFVRKEE